MLSDSNSTFMASSCLAPLSVYDCWTSCNNNTRNNWKRAEEIWVTYCSMCFQGLGDYKVNFSLIDSLPHGVKPSKMFYVGLFDCPVISSCVAIAKLWSCMYPLWLSNSPSFCISKAYGGPFWEHLAKLSLDVSEGAAQCFISTLNGLENLHRGSLSRQ